MNKEEFQQSQKYIQWIINQYVAWRMGILEEWKVKHRDEIIRAWRYIAASDIAAAQIGRIVSTNFRQTIKQNIPAPWDIVVQTVQNELKSVFTKFGHGAVEK